MNNCHKLLYLDLSIISVPFLLSFFLAKRLMQKVQNLLVPPNILECKRHSWGVETRFYWFLTCYWQIAYLWGERKKKRGGGVDNKIQV